MKTIILFLAIASGCSLSNDFDKYTFEAASDAETHPDAETPPPDGSAGMGGSTVEAGAGGKNEVDAAPDTGTPDTGTPDTGTDTGTPDTGPPEPLSWCGLCTEGSDVCAEGLGCYWVYGGASCQQECECEVADNSRCTPCDTGRCLYRDGHTPVNDQGVHVKRGFCVSSDFIYPGFEDWEMPLLDAEKLQSTCGG